MNNSNILVVEDDAAIRSLITTALETENYKYVPGQLFQLL